MATSTSPRILALVAAISVVVLSLSAIQPAIDRPASGIGPAESTGSAGSVESADDTAAAVGSADRRQKAMGWIGGLATKLILPTDVTRRLARQDTAVAAAVTEAWAELESLRGDTQQVEKAVAWLRGLVAGHIITSDLRRLRQQDPQLAVAVVAALEHLRAL